MKSATEHHNLAVAYAKKPDFVNASLELTQAIKLFNSPLSRLEELHYLRDVQRSLGIQHSSLEKPYLVGLYTVSKEVLAAFGMIAFWSIFLFFYLQYAKRRSYKILPLLAGTSCTIVLLFWVLLKTMGALGVLQGTQDVAVYSSSEMKEKIVSLPPGTLVRVRKSKEGNHQILDPIYGWIRSSDCLLTGLPELADSPS